jgi:hypothetical protein
MRQVQQGSRRRSSHARSRGSRDTAHDSQATAERPEVPAPPPRDPFDERPKLLFRILTHNATIMGTVMVLLVGGLYFINFNVGKDKPPPAGSLSIDQLNTILTNAHVDKAEADAVAAAKERAHDQAVAQAAALAAKAKHDAKLRAELKAKAAASAKAQKLKDDATNPSANMVLGQEMNSLKGWGSCWPSLKTMWMHESDWDQTAENPSGAYGIPQALPGDKMSQFGADWRTSSATQIAWGLSYIAERYNNPCDAWSFWQAHSWY